MFLCALLSLAVCASPAVAAEPVGCPTPVGATEPSPVTASSPRDGVIDLVVAAPAGSAIAVGECTRISRTPLAGVTATDGTTRFDELVAWACERVYRQFYATIRTPQGVESIGLAEIATPPCTDRFSLTGPRRVKVGAPVRALLTDAWGTGDVRGRFCVISPRGRKRCKSVRLGVAERKRSLPFTATKRGTWTAQFTRAGVVKTLRIAAGSGTPAPAKLPRVVATGDSTMLGVATSLAEELAGEVDVLERTNPGSGISSAGDPWRGYAASQARLKPRLVVWSLGVAEGYTMQGIECCGEAWQAEYSERLARALASYRRGGAKVLLVTPPVPRDPRRGAIVAVATAMVVKAGESTPGVSLARIDQLVSPNGYAETIRYRGSDVAIRNPDGIHLNRAGQAIAAGALAPTVRRLLAEA